jgi:hypothetical protein
VQEPAPQAECSVEPATVAPGETVTIDASESANTETVDYDPDGDGTYERREQTTFRLDWTYNETGNFTSRVRVRAGDQTDTADCGAVTVSAPDEGIPWLPIGAGVAGLLGLGGLSWYVLRGRGKSPGGSGSGSGGGGGGDERPRRPRKPRTPSSSEQRPVRYETGVFELPRTSGPITVEVGFEPDLVLLEATNGARTDSAVDRTAGWSRGLARVADGTTQYAVTVADDSQSTDQATCAVSDTRALELLRHESDGAPGRVALTVADTTDDGFEVDVSVPGDDPLAGGIRVLYRAFQTATGVETALDHFRTPTEPGTQTVDLGVDADHVSLTAGAAVTEPGRLWTTDRGVGLSVGHGVSGPDTIEQAVCGTSVWPRAGHDSAAVAGSERALGLLYKESDRVAGRLSADIAALGRSLRLQYDRVYSGPNKLGSTARHVVPYLAVAGEAMRPAVGAVSLPAPGESLTVDCGFEPGLVELRIVPAPVEETVSTGATAQPFGWSQGTAIDTGNGLRQYVLHHAFVPPADAATAGTIAGSRETATTDGGTATADPGEETTADAGGESTDASAAWSGPTDAVAGTPGATGGGDGSAVAAAPERPSDGLAGLALVQAADGTVLGREECRVTGLHAQGFDVAVERVATDRAVETDRPTLVYRAWPAAGERADADATAEAGSETASESTDTGTRATSEANGGANR